MRNKNILSCTLMFCLGILLFFFISVLTRFLTRQILVKRMHADNAFTHLIFAGNQAMNDDTDKNWAAKYPFRSGEKGTPAAAVAKSNRYESLVYKLKNGIKTYTQDLLVGRYTMAYAARSYNNLIGCSVMQTDASEQDSVIRLKNGYLANEADRIDEADIQEIADNVQDFTEYLKAKDIDFVYLNTGSKICPYDDQLPAGSNEHTNENGDHLIRALNERGINTLDIRDHMINDSLDWYQSYYITDHHWKTTTSLWAAGVTAQYLNDHFGFDFDPYYFDPAQYNIDSFPDYFLGGQGRVMTLANCSLESYDRILPRFDTSFLLEIPARKIHMQGSYREVLFDEEHFDSIASYSARDFSEKSDAYHSMRLKNDAYGKIVNLAPKNNRDKKILMIYDSFCWYLSSFLATDISEIVTLHLSDFNGSVCTLVDETDPDIVIVAYCEASINPLDNRSSHTEMYDFE